MIEADLLAAGLTLLAAACAALVTAGGRARRALGLVIVAVAAAIPALGAPTAVRAVLGIAQLLLTFRVIELYRERRVFSIARRLWHVASIVDSRTLVRRPRSFDTTAFLGFVGWGALSGAGIILAWQLPSRAGWWAGGLVASYALVEALWASARWVYALLGFATPVLHALPLVSRTVQELWGERWATPVRRWLHTNLFLPLARRGWPRAGIVLAFFVSALGHAYLVFMCVGWEMAARMLAYFLVQAGLVVVERGLGVSRWPAIAAHVWVVGVMILTAPLFTEPMLRCVGL